MTEHNGQQKKQHLTTAQLSALLDGQLPIEEREFSDAHLVTCEQCQQELESLRQTVMLLHALPRPELPRSFILPFSTQQTTTLAPITPLTTRNSTSRRNGTRSYYARTALRTFGTLAAMVGLVLLLSSLIPFVNQRGGGSAASSGSSQNMPASKQAGTSPSASPSPILPHLQGTAGQHPTQPAQGNTLDAPSLPPLLDIGTSVGRAFFGLLLLLLGILGLIFGRRRKRHQGP